MNKSLLIVLAAIFAMAFVLNACGDEDKDVCEQAADIAMEAMEEVCGDYPDCMICEEPEEPADGEAEEQACEDETEEFAQLCVDDEEACKTGAKDMYEGLCTMPTL